MTALLAVAGFLLPDTPNPVLPETNDIGVAAHAGENFLMGMGTAAFPQPARKDKKPWTQS